MSGKFSLDDYVDVAERIGIFREKHPDGSLRAKVIAWPTETFPFVAVQAEAFRSPMDEAPGVGLAWEPFPGRTPYTKDSELQVAETSAWGRAIVAVLAADTKRGIASKQEVRNRDVGDQRRGGDPSGSSVSGDVRANTSRPAGPSPDSSESQGLTGASAQDSGSSGGGEVGSVDGEAAGPTEPPSDSLEQLFSLYSNQGQALRAANKKFGTKTIAELHDLGPAALATLIREKEGTVGAA